MKLLATKSNVFYSGQWVFKIGWPNMGALNVEAADSFLQKDFNRPLYFIVDQCKKQPTRSNFRSMPWGPFLESPGNCSGPETCFVFVVFAFKMKVLIILKIIQ